MKIMNLICSSSSTVWDGNGFTECFDDMIFGFGVNLVTLILVVVIAFRARHVERNNRTTTQAHPSEKVFLYLLPTLGACLSLCDMVLVMRKLPHRQSVMYHVWFSKCSQFLVWVSIVIFWKCHYRIDLFYNPVICFWWILKPMSGVPHLSSTFATFEVIKCLRGSFSVILDITFGLYVNIVRVKLNATKLRKYDLLEDPLLSCNKDLEKYDKDFDKTYYDRLTFKSITSVMDVGAVKQLDFDDLLQLPSELNPSSCFSTLLRCWVAEQSNNEDCPSLFLAICYAYGWQYFRLGLLKVSNDCVGFVGPILLNKLIWFLQQGSGHLEGYVLAISLGFASIIKSFLDTQYTYHLSKLKLKLRSSIMTVIYKKCLCISLAERSKFSDGEIQTFMSIDADRTVNLCASFHDMWSLPLQILVALYLLYTQVKFAFVSGLTITILLIPVNKWLSTLITSATEKMMKQKDERIRRAGELLVFIRTIKLYGWELLFSDRLKETRSLEVKYLSTRKYLDAWCVFFWATTPTLFSLATFGLFTLTGHSLDAATVFTCLALFNTLISPLNSFPWVINGLIDAIVSTRRLSKFLACAEYIPERIPSFSECWDDSTQHMAVVIRGATSNWSSSKDEKQGPILKDITLSLPKGFLVAVIGEVGSGKSALLNLVLEEMNLHHGSIQLCGSIAYVSQVTWVLSGTIRDNILFGKSYDAKRYAEVIHACALDEDLSLMIGGDQAYVGEKGVNLSGGQKARLALARALYYGADIFMFDDVLSAVDAQVACWILQQAIFGTLTNQQTRILCTHNLQAISSADMIVVMEKGYVKWNGSVADFSSSPHSSLPSLKESAVSSSPFVVNDGINNASADAEHHSLLQKGPLNISEEAHELIGLELRKEGKVEIAVYKNYANFSSWPVTIVIFLSAMLMQASRCGNDLWLSHWVDTTVGGSLTNYSTSFYLVILCIFCAVNSLLTLIRAFSFAFGGLRAAVQVHDKLLNKLINAPVYFFDQTPCGRILNRLSSDLYTIDDSLPFMLNILLANFMGVLGILLVLSYVQVIFLLLLLPFWCIYSKLQLYYRSTSRELRRLDSISRSPIYASFTETLDGSSTIRAFKSEDIFLEKFTKSVALYQQTSFSELTASLWLSLRLQLLAALVVSFIAVMAVLGCRGGFFISFGTPGLVGLALSYAAPYVSLLSSFLSSFTETEKEMVSVERVLQYMDVPQEELQGCQLIHPDWPFKGQIDFRNVTLRYMPTLPPSLRGVTFTIAGGMQVGIVGRTGAGKSSVLNALFRLSPICCGHILVDDINVIDVPIRDLRAHFAVVPQSPFLFEGSLRENLDPSLICTDSKIWEALEKCNIKEEVKALGGLDIHVKEGGTTFSVGQRQLICLARALLKCSKVLCLDECTANIDTKTAAILQNAIYNECKGMTVITIAHRISTVLNMDNILVLDSGILVEQGNPQELLQDKLSRFSSFAEASVM